MTEGQQEPGNSWPEEARTPAHVCSPLASPPAHMIPSGADVSNHWTSLQGLVPAKGHGHLEGDIIVPSDQVCVREERKKEWGFFIFFGLFWLYFFLKVLLLV